MFKNNVKYKFKDLTAKLIFLASNNNIAEFFNRAIGPMDDLYSIEVIKSDEHGARAKHIKVNGSYIYWDGHKDYYMLIHGNDDRYFEEIVKEEITKFETNVKYKFKSMATKRDFLSDGNRNRNITVLAACNLADDDLGVFSFFETDGKCVSFKNLICHGKPASTLMYKEAIAFDSNDFDYLEKIEEPTKIAETTGGEAIKTEIKKSVDLDSIITQEMKKSGAVLKLLNFANTLDLSDENRKIVISIAKDIRNI